MERALGQVADADIKTTCAGRTDAGVHATCQVVHFDTPIDRGEKAWIRGVNSLLPDSIRVLWAQSVSAEFHARFSATSRRYQYVIYQRDTASAIMAGHVTHLRDSLDCVAMDNAAQHLLGEQDFSVFRAAGCQSKTPFRNVSQVSVTRHGSFIVIDIRANAFLQHMVRNITGALLDVGRGVHAVDWIRRLISLKDRAQSSATASPDGLYLVGVSYPGEFKLPACEAIPAFLPTST